MRKINVLDELLLEVNDFLNNNNNKLNFIFIGGYSRCGKSSLSKELYLELKKYYTCKILPLDLWIVDIEKRKINSTVFERFDLNMINKSLIKLLNFNEIELPLYDPITRKQIIEKNPSKFKIEQGVLIIEGVVALEVAKKIPITSFKIFVNTTRLKRLKRLISFYRDFKKLPRNEYKKIINEREAEEIPLIRETSITTNIFFNN